MNTVPHRHEVKVDYRAKVVVYGETRVDFILLREGSVKRAIKKAIYKHDMGSILAGEEQEYKAQKQRDRDRMFAGVASVIPPTHVIQGPCPNLGPSCTVPEHGRGEEIKEWAYKEVAGRR